MFIKINLKINLPVQSQSNRIFGITIFLIFVTYVQRNESRQTRFLFSSLLCALRFEINVSCMYIGDVRKACGCIYI